MAIYSYACDRCGARFDISATLEQKESGDPGIFQCPDCQATTITRQFTSVGILNSGKNGTPPHGCPTGNCPYSY